MLINTTFFLSLLYMKRSKCLEDQFPNIGPSYIVLARDINFLILHCHFLLYVQAPVSFRPQGTLRSLDKRRKLDI